jgi:crotonobetainyl-CoA:carnitine CoA-transferase CaiB-like acyl-CoA transferase
MGVDVMKSSAEKVTKFEPQVELRKLVQNLGLDEEILEKATFTGEDPILKARVRLAASIGLPIMAAAVAVASVWKQRTGRSQSLHLDLRKAVHGISTHVTWNPQLGGSLYPHPLVADNPFLLDSYKTKDGRTVMASGVYPHLASSWLRFLDCPPDKEKVAAAFARWNSEELEEAAAEANLPLSIARSPEEWQAHPQGQALAGVPIVQLKKLGDAPAKPRADGPRPLSGVKILSFTHAIAGPTVGRTLAEQGAQVLNATFPNHYEHDFIYAEANVGSRSANIDLRKEQERAQFEELLKETDILVNNHRHGKLEAHGLKPETLLEKRPGLIIVKISCFGSQGPFAQRGGFDMNASAATGLMWAEGTGEPRLPPTGMINDFSTGYLASVGATAALKKRAEEGGSWLVEVSLCRTAMWIQSLGLVDPKLAGQGEQHTLQDPAALEVRTPLGRLRRLAPPVEFSETPGRWEHPVLVPRGSSDAVWH